MAFDFNFMIGGEAGQGIQSITSVLSKTMLRGGYEVFADQDFESRIRGGHSFSRVRVSDEPIEIYNPGIDILIALSKETIARHQAELKLGGAIVADREKIDYVEKPNIYDVPIDRLAMESGGAIMANSVASGAVLGLVSYDFDRFAAVLKDEYIHHGADIADNNIKAARSGYDYVKRYSGKYEQRITPRPERPDSILLTGHDAVALGALAAGCNFVAGYPMTPTTTILEYIASNGLDHGIPLVEAEDEISAIGMVIGASFAGARAMTATSGSGFSLMVEHLGLAGITETPIVVILGQRPGPAIGLPTRTEQGELLFALHASNGEFARAILAPSGAEDAFWLTVKGFNLAEKYQTPVIVLTDHDLANSSYTVNAFDLSKVQIDRGALLSADESDKAGTEYKRYAFTQSGISPRALPSQGKALVVADSDEHNEEGHIIEDGETRRRMVDKRMGKLTGLKTEIAPPRTMERPGARLTLVGWGSTWGAIREAANILESQGRPVNLIHLVEVFPFPAEKFLAALKKTGRFVIIESNSIGQLGRLIRAETGLTPEKSILKYDGRPFSAPYIIEALKEVK